MVMTLSAAGGARAAAPASVVQASDRTFACWWDPAGRASFSGTVSWAEVGGRTIIQEQVGVRGSDLVVQKGFGDPRLCMIAEDVADRRRLTRPSEWASVARRVVMESRRGDVSERGAISSLNEDRYRREEADNSRLTAQDEKVSRAEATERILRDLPAPVSK